MFQSFEEQTDDSAGAGRLTGLRDELALRGLDGFIIPHADRYQGEYLAPGDERLMWLTGFSGSAGAAVVLIDAAAVFVDGRYTVQAARQVDGDAFAREDFTTASLGAWLESHVPKGGRIGYDPWLHTISGATRLRTAVETAGGTLVETDGNPIDSIWLDRPPPPAGAVSIQPLELAGQASAEKLAEIRSSLAKDGDDAVLISLSDSICWLFNIRGSDVAHTPIVQGFALIEAGSAALFVAEEKLDEDVRAWIAPHALICPEDQVGTALDALGKDGAVVRIDPETAADWFRLRLSASGATLRHGRDPCILPKARKNAVEAEGARAAHRRDGVAMAQFLAWFETAAARGDLDEIAAATKLESFRKQTNQLLDISFDTISAAGPNAALPHYRVSTESNRMIAPSSFFLIDSGGQYRDGTTDITRTIAVGTVTDEMKRRYTQVLRGHIAVATVRFPPRTSGAQIDTLARLPLWLDGEDFDHGTGHGVGSYLSVHEGPQRISKAGGSVALEPGMILSNEPGFYREGHFGIRIENLVIVTEATEIEGGSRPMLGFKTLSFTPIDTRPLLPELMRDDEIAWLDAYHAETRSRLAGSLDGADRDWLVAATAPIGHGDADRSE